MTPACRAVRVNDQMICPCGMQWDVGEDKPACPTAKKPTAGRRRYLVDIKQKYGIEGVKK